MTTTAPVRPDAQTPANAPDAVMPLREHLAELRSRLIKAMVALFVGTGAGWILRDRITNALTRPACLLQHVHGVGTPTSGCPNGALVLQGVLAPLGFSFKIALAAGMILSSPVWSYQLWAFVAPGLYRREKRFGLAFVAAAVPLFLAGAALAYEVFPKGLDILASFNPSAFGLMIEGDQFLDFFLRMVLVFGLSFELPVLIVALNHIRAISAARLRRMWRPVIFGIFVFSAVAVPTGDPLTMTVLAVPICLLFLASLGICTLHDQRNAARNEALADDEVAPLPPPRSIEPDDTP
ncbi:twin-arginine translocase subunit TatC [Streptacidiphilus jiangxiensis]|uniref:Sec-independent protein translocase protein TatC n=1 Tax=Streptacidiphilus jiangxiensis TaxID=235985 RepID=A0A1H7NSF1_STRJI|nr:twin-arginine translocase subunit TatC [Streptacidiphilus jiangxiensis]SEL26301.1 sec-independent protein translocase protein TatC [Streptacidiphilus jiangxiensis]